jgi:hypothetical protein
LVTRKVFAERKPIPSGKRSRKAKQENASAVAVGDFTEFGTLPIETIIRLGLRHVYTMPVVLEDKSTKQVLIYLAEVLEDNQWRTVYVQGSAD